MGRKGRKQWQQQEYDSMHQRIREEIRKLQKTTVMELHKSTKISRTTIRKHLDGLVEGRELTQIGHTYYWGNPDEAARLRFILEILHKQEETLEKLIAVAEYNETEDETGEKLVQQSVDITNMIVEDENRSHIANYLRKLIAAYRSATWLET